MKHVFAVAAYGESEYLRETLSSLAAQSEEAETIVCTSTPSESIENLAAAYGFRVFERTGKSSLKDDWNFAAETAVRECGADLVTVAHQDDIYDTDYAKALREAYTEYPDMSLFCTGFSVIDSAGNETKVSYEKVKKFLSLPLTFRSFAHLRFIKRLPLVFGNSICAPSCTYSAVFTGLPLFADDRDFVIDWLTLLRLSKKPGRFVMDRRPLVRYRIHEDSESMRLTKTRRRAEEEYEVYRLLYPAPIAAIFSHFLKLAYSAYEKKT